MEAVRRFLDRLPAGLQRDRVEAGRPDQLASMEAWGDAWRALCAEIGHPCPVELAALGDAMRDVLVYFRFEGHAYLMYTPQFARDERAFLATLAAQHDVLAPCAAMLPVFGEDGDSLLLATDGAIWSLLHDDWERAKQVAPSLRAMLDGLTAPVLNPRL